jgi:hypothetical protein
MCGMLGTPTSCRRVYTFPLKTLLVDAPRTLVICELLRLHVENDPATSRPSIDGTGIKVRSERPDTRDNVVPVLDVEAHGIALERVFVRLRRRELADALPYVRRFLRRGLEDCRIPTARGSISFPIRLQERDELVRVLDVVEPLRDRDERVVPVEESGMVACGRMSNSRGQRRGYDVPAKKTMNAWVRKLL